MNRGDYEGIALILILLTAFILLVWLVIKIPLVGW